MFNLNAKACLNAKTFIWMGQNPVATLRQTHLLRCFLCFVFSSGGHSLEIHPTLEVYVCELSSVANAALEIIIIVVFFKKNQLNITWERININRIQFCSLHCQQNPKWLAQNFAYFPVGYSRVLLDNWMQKNIWLMERGREREGGEASRELCIH